MLEYKINKDKQYLLHNNNSDKLIDLINFYIKINMNNLIKIIYQLITMKIKIK